MAYLTAIAGDMLVHCSGIWRVVPYVLQHPLNDLGLALASWEQDWDYNQD